jgi:hypothetical protein
VKPLEKNSQRSRGETKMIEIESSKGTGGPQNIFFRRSRMKGHENCPFRFFDLSNTVCMIILLSVWVPHRRRLPVNEVADGGWSEWRKNR